MKTLLTGCNLNSKLTNILVDGEVISKIGSQNFQHEKQIDIAGNLVLPGMIDLHTHVRDMNQSYKEDWLSASRAALRGGVSAIFDMPNTIPPTTNHKNYLQKKEHAKKSLVNYGIYAGATPHNFHDIEILLEKESRVAGIKIFLAGSSSNDVISDHDLIKKFFVLAKRFDKPVLVHCELQDTIETQLQLYNGEEFNSVLYHNKIRNTGAAAKAVELVLSIADKIKNKLLLLHISSAEEINIIKKYKQNLDFPLFCEVTPHYLLINESILQRIGNCGKVNPPLRTSSDNVALWKALDEGIIDTIGSDHAPHSLEEKLKKYDQAPSGFPGLETTLPLLFNEAINNKRISVEKIVKLTSSQPAEIMKIHRRGFIRDGYYADLTVIDPKISWTIDAQKFASKAKYSPYDGMEVSGKVVFTMINGEINNPQGKEVTYD
jgi:dihydroorotase